MQHQAKTYEQLLVELEQVKSERDRVASDLVAARQEAERVQVEVDRQLGERARELTERAALLENVIYNTPAAIAYLDRDLVIRISNQANSKFLGIPNEQIVNHPILDVIPGGGTQLADLMRHVMETKKPYTTTDYELTYQMPDGTERTTYWEFAYCPVVLNEEDGAMGLLSVSQEVSVRIERDRERKNAQLRGERLKVLEESDRLKDQFLGILSHELRTPLNAILGFGSILADGIAGDLKPEQAKYVGKILDSSDVMLGLVDDLLDMSRVQAGKFALDLQTVEIAPVVRSTLANLAADAMKKGHSLVTEVPVTLPSVKADPRRVSQVLSNLVTNAVKYTPEGGTIQVRARVEGEVIRVEVADTGLGVSAEQQARIFQAFTQVDMTNTRAKGGVGLGLSIVKALVEAHGGEVGVESEGEGKGSTFFFTLPLGAH
jgi:signal transduction histidine kinase